MNQSTRVIRRSAADILPLDQRDPQTSRGRVTGDAGPVDPGADHDQIEYVHRFWRA